MLFMICVVGFDWGNWLFMPTDLDSSRSVSQETGISLLATTWKKRRLVSQGACDLLHPIISISLHIYPSHFACCDFFGAIHTEHIFALKNMRRRQWKEEKTQGSKTCWTFNLCVVFLEWRVMREMRLCIFCSKHNGQRCLSSACLHKTEN